MLRLALIGGAEFAAQYSLALARIPNARIVAVADDKKKIAAATAETVGAEVWTRGFKRLLGDDSGAFDAVIVHAPLAKREAACRLAGQAGKHILVQEPMALSLAAARDVIDVCEAAGVVLMPCRPLRFLPTMRAVKESVDSGRLGELGLVRIHRWKPVDRYYSSLPLIGRLSGEIDLARWLFGQVPTNVFVADQNSRRDKSGIPDYLQVHLGFPRGGMALIDSATLPKGDGYFSFTVIGSTGAAYADDHHNKHLLFDGGHPTALAATLGAGAIGAQLQEFVAAIQAQPRSWTAARDSLSTLEVEEAAEKALLSEEFTLPDMKPEKREAVVGQTRGHGDAETRRIRVEPLDPGLPRFRCAVLSVVKHAYVPRGVASHPRFELVVVADDAHHPAWVHERNQKFADEYKIPYVRDVEKAIRDYRVQVAVVSSEAERHCDLSVRAANLGLHIVQDKPMSNRLSECDRVVKAVERTRVKFMMWNRNFLPAVVQAREVIEDGDLGKLFAIHVDFYFSKDAGPPKGSRREGDPPLDWLSHQIVAHADGSDGGLGREPMGELAIEGIYPLAYIRMLTGREVTRVFAHTAAHIHQVNADNGVEDLASVTLELEPGLSPNRIFVGSLCLGRIGAASHPDIGEIKIHVLGTKGALVVSEARPEIAVYYRGQPAQEFRHRRVANDNDYLLMENFAQAIDRDGQTMLDARAGRAICATVMAAIESARTGKPVVVS